MRSISVEEKLAQREQAAQIARQLALSLGQDETLLQQVARRELYPAMAAFGLWREESEFDDLL